MFLFRGSVSGRNSGLGSFCLSSVQPAQNAFSRFIDNFLGSSTFFSVHRQMSEVLQQQEVELTTQQLLQMIARDSAESKLRMERFEETWLQQNSRIKEIQAATRKLLGMAEPHQVETKAAPLTKRTAL